MSPRGVASFWCPPLPDLSRREVCPRNDLTLGATSSLAILKLSDHLARTYVPGPEGLLRRLRDLIERGRIDIGQIRLADVMRWMLALGRQDDRDSIGALCSTLEAAARLALLKARRLCGLWEAATEEEPAPWLGPPPELPLRRSWLAERVAAGPLSFVGPPRRFDAVAPPLARIAPAQLREAMIAVLGRQRRLTPTAATPQTPRISTEARSALILEQLAQHREVRFQAIAGESRDAHVATFLACLILARQGRVALEQDELFRDIVVRPAAEAWTASA